MSDSGRKLGWCEHNEDKHTCKDCKIAAQQQQIERLNDEANRHVVELNNRMGKIRDQQQQIEHLTKRDRLRGNLADMLEEHVLLVESQQQEIETLRSFVYADYISYEPTHPYAAALREKFPWLETK